ncbi:xylose repressor [Paenibacillus sp. J31TS4]|uniref:ROK family transcriptional regulator n=1 Tax=Paenibacillus sp. J31TS4 TaxID=2807195 RepID=UPI001B06F67C|nr:ROK family transcriptional regulator [Paenibacillus sp. J31TS4]GIP40901.1 xylose repressor [Paenibacillus sp. J31TS4]
MSAEKTPSHQLLKSINQQKVLHLIFAEGPISRVELADKTGLNQQTITNIVNRLLKDQLVVEGTPSASSGGRKPVPLTINGKDMYAIGIEVAVRYIRGVLMNFAGDTIAAVEHTVTKYDDQEHPVRLIGEAVQELLTSVPDLSKLKGIGCSIQALVNTKQGVIVYSPGLRWNHFPLKQRLEERFGIPVYLENDVNLHAVVENMNGLLSDSLDNVTLKFDYGFGGAVVFQKQLYAGANHVAGEFGHYKGFTGEHAYLCHCGRKGCLTQLASSSGLYRNKGLRLHAFNEAIRAKDPASLELLDVIIEAVGTALSNIITFFNPDHVMLTGRWIETMGDILVPAFREKVQELVPESCRSVKLVYTPVIPDDAILAVGLVKKYYFDVPLDSLSLQN